MAGIASAAAGALIVAALSTFGDFAWAQWVTRHRAILGLIHGTLLCLGIEWMRPAPGPPDYAYHFGCWAIAFLPGFLALLADRRSGNEVGA